MHFEKINTIKTWCVLNGMKDLRKYKNKNISR